MEESCEREIFFTRSLDDQKLRTLCMAQFDGNSLDPSGKIHSNTRSLLGDDEQIILWEDWLGTSPLVDQFPDLYTICLSNMLLLGDIKLEPHSLQDIVMFGRYRIHVFCCDFWTEQHIYSSEQVWCAGVVGHSIGLFSVNLASSW